MVNAEAITLTVRTLSFVRYPSTTHTVLKRSFALEHKFVRLTGKTVPIRSVNQDSTIYSFLHKTLMIN